MAKQAPVTEKLTIDLTAEERANLDALAERYGRMSVGACVRWLIAEKVEGMNAIVVKVGGMIGAGASGKVSKGSAPVVPGVVYTDDFGPG